MRALLEIVNQNPTTCFLHVDFDYVLYIIPHPLGSEQFCVDQQIHVQVPPPVDLGGGNIKIAAKERYV